MDTQPGRTAPRDSTRTKVLDAARDLLASGNFAALTMDAISVAAGVSKATVYRWWSNRAAVAMEVLLEAAGSSTPYLEADGPLANLRRHVRVAADFLGGPDGAMLAGIVADAQHDSALAETFRRDYLAHRRALIIGLMNDAVAEGELSGGINPEVLADQLIAPFYYRLLLGHAAIEPGLADTVFDLAIDPQRR